MMSVLGLRSLSLCVDTTDSVPEIGYSSTSLCLVYTFVAQRSPSGSSNANLVQCRSANSSTMQSCATSTYSTQRCISISCSLPDAKATDIWQMLLYNTGRVQERGSSDE